MPRRRPTRRRSARCSTTSATRSLGNTGTTVSLIVAFTVLLALIGTTLACLNTGVRVTYSMAKDKEMPSILGLLHGEFATPHGGIWILTASRPRSASSARTRTRSTTSPRSPWRPTPGRSWCTGPRASSPWSPSPAATTSTWSSTSSIPGVGALMNIAVLFGVVYLAVTIPAATPGDAYKALGVVVIWILIGVVWVLSTRTCEARSCSRTRANDPRRRSERASSEHVTSGGRGARAPRPPDVRGEASSPSE